MPKVKRKLTEVEIKNSKPKEKPYKLYDEGGLLLLNLLPFIGHSVKSI